MATAGHRKLQEFMNMVLEREYHDNMELENEHKAIMKLDEELFSILKDFIDDYDTMKLFAKMVEIKAHIVERQIIISINSTLFSLQILKQRRNHVSKSRFHRCFSHNPVAYVRDWLLAAAIMISASMMVFPC